MAYRCIRCGREWNDKDAADNAFLCTRKCGGGLIPQPVRESADDRAAGMAVNEASLSALPCIIAIPLHEYDLETHPVLRLWLMCETVELSIRLIAATVLAGVARPGQLPDELAQACHELRIEEPTLGGWRRIAEEALKHLPAKDPLAPLMGPLFTEHIAPLLDGPGRRGATVENSLSALRNQLAHGGGITRTKAGTLLSMWAPRFVGLRQALNVLADVKLVVCRPGGYGVLRGPTKTPEVFQPDDALRIELERTFASARSLVVLVHAVQAYILWPLALYDRPRPPGSEQMTAAEAPQIYCRRDEVALAYTPLGSDEACVSAGSDSDLKRFLEFFQVRADRRQADQAFSIRDFEDDIRREASKRVGREAELEKLRAMAIAHDHGVLWVSGTAGIGKSCLLAAFAAEILNSPPGNALVLPYCFRMGDDRCRRQDFLRFCLERLDIALGPLIATEEQPGPGMAGPGKKPPPQSKDLKPEEVFDFRLKNSCELRLIFILDGLDEIMRTDATFASDIILRHRDLPAVLWICAGRPEGRLPELFGPDKAVPVFDAASGLPPMSENDVRGMIMEKIGPLTRKLLANDRDITTTDGRARIQNGFIEKVTRLAEGRPQYVKYVVGDILGNRYRALDAGELLPESLNAYYAELMKRYSVGSLHSVLTPIVGILAVAEEPLTDAALAALLVTGGHRAIIPRAAGAESLVRRGLQALGGVVRRDTDQENKQGWTLDHDSLRQYLADKDPDVIQAARNIFANVSRILPWSPALVNYLVRHAVGHLCSVMDTDPSCGDEAQRLLTSFDYLMEKARLNDYESLSDEYAKVMYIISSGRDQLRPWQNFFRERMHILRRGNDRWPAYKILVQLAMEHADDSPVTKQAEAWLEQGRCDWFWLRNARRISQASPNPCCLVLEGHTNDVTGALALSDDRILSWSFDQSLRIWDARTGLCRTVLAGHTELVQGGLVLPDGRILSWADDMTLRVWDAVTGKCHAILEGPNSRTMEARVLPANKILTWSEDKTLRILDVATGTCRAVLDGHAGSVSGALVLPDGGILSWAQDKTLRIWDPVTGKCRLVLEGHAGSVSGALVLPDGGILSWAGDETLRVWNADTGKCIAVHERHNFGAYNVQLMPDGRLLLETGCRDPQFQILDVATGSCRAMLKVHAELVQGALGLPDGGILWWEEDKTPQIWDIVTGKCRARLEGHTGRITGALVLPDDRILTWSRDRTLRIWCAAKEICRLALEGHAILEGQASGIVYGRSLPDGGILACSFDNTPRVWDAVTGKCRAILEGHTDRIKGDLGLPPDKILTWSEDKTLRIWDFATGECLAVLEGHTQPVVSAWVLPDGRILSWADDATLRVWDAITGKCRAVLGGHINSHDSDLLLLDGGILSWAQDALRIWDFATGECRAVLRGHNGNIRGALVLPDNGILSWSDDKTLRIWEPSTGKCRAVLEGHTHWVMGALLLPNGSVLSWALDKTLRIWDTSTGERCAVLRGHTGDIEGALVLPDNSILSWSEDKTLRIWDVVTGMCRKDLRGHQAIIQYALVLSDGNILSDAEDGTFRVWNVQTWKMCAVIAKNEILFQRPDLLASLPYISSAASSEWVAGDIGHVVVLAHTIAPLRVIWQAACPCIVGQLLPDGTVFAMLDDGHVSFLKLYHGSRRVTLDEAREVMIHTPPMAAGQGP